MTVLYETPSPAVVQITLNRAESLNAFNERMRIDAVENLARAAADPAVRAVVLTGAGRGFSAGADVREGFGRRTVEDLLNTEYAPIMSVVRTCEKPVIAAINGPAAGIGMTLALTCDLRVMSEDAYLMAAFGNIGLIPDGGLSWHLTQGLGYARAFEAAIECQKIPAADCLRAGLVNRVVPADACLQNALDWAASLSERAPISVALTKRAFRAAAQGGLAAAAELEAVYQKTAIATEDFAEGVSALTAKRTPTFKGR
ncbi:MAG: enoyl-CoA hydratase-related protein [Pseudomonadota bacterium]